MKRILVYIVLIVCSIDGLYAQDPQFSQFYAAPLYLNPAFAGANLKTRANFIYRNQWSSIPGTYVTMAASADQNLEEFKSGAGVLFMTDKAGSSQLKQSLLGLLYSYNLQIADKFVVRAGLQFGWLQSSVNYNNLIFSSQLDPDIGVTGAVSGESLEGIQRKSVFDFGTGFLGYTEKWWLGGAAHHVNQPDLGFGDVSTGELPMKVSIHGGMKLKIVKDEFTNDQREFTFSPAFMYKAQGKFDQLDLGFYINYNPVVLGLWYRGLPGIKKYDEGFPNNDAVVALIGFHQDYLTIGYSYDLTVSLLGPSTGGSHEISIGYDFYYERKKRKMLYEKYIPCPKF